MLRFVAFLWLTAAMSATVKDLVDMDEVLGSVKQLIAQYTDMVVLDSVVYEGQVHLLVDGIRLEPDDKFNIEMKKLTDQGLISITSANTTNFHWPAEKILIGLVPGEDDNIPTKSEVFTKRREDVLTVLMYEQFNCHEQNSMSNNIAVARQGCYTVRHPAIQSARIINYSDRAICLVVYQGDCKSKVKGSYKWYKGNSRVCYKLNSGNSIVWDWL